MALRWVALWVGLAGCSSLPEFAQPRGRVLDPSTLSGGDLIRYRPLKRSDFRAAAPPAEAAAHAERLGALTCAYIATTPDTAYEIRETVRGARRTYGVRFGRLGFIAHMDRECSWWNERAEAASATYVLQHEQIHFALAELESRRRNREARELLHEWTEEAETVEEAKALVEDKLRRLVDEAMSDLLAVSEDFDEDTSAEHSPQRQNEWERRVTQELNALANYKAR